jgi:hypothetical protein
MNQQYKELHKRAESLEYRLRDKLDDKQNPLARKLSEELKSFINEIESEKHPKSLENSAKNIQNLLKSAASQGDSVMDYTDLDFFDDRFEDIRMDLRKFDNY